MKKKLPLVGIILFLLTAAWSAAAMVLLRGVGAYRLGTGLGTALAVARPFTSIAAVLLAIVLVIWLLARKSAKAAIEPAAAGESAGEAPAASKPVKEKKAKKEKKKEIKADEGKIPPAPAEPKIQPKAPEAAGETVLVSNLNTEDLRKPVEPVAVPAEPVQEAAYEAATELIPAEPEQDEGAVEAIPSVPEQDEGATELMPAPVVDAVPCCPQCGEPIVKEGQRFCAKCGTELKGGGV